MKGTKKKTPCNKKLGGYLKEQKGRLYIIRRCVTISTLYYNGLIEERDRIFVVVAICDVSGVRKIEI
ncbi:hypothetical protein AtNW77_Chr1g0067881 [Arabidopsis thaliana]|uniref:Uncharacterized protein n=1 Tax=Arabidopsis thaliana TaxID=3702 RepID=A0A654EN91_ARATH|nr:unnamed protein product [Arabidopsis thaliana]